MRGADMELPYDNNEEEIVEGTHADSLSTNSPDTNVESSNDEEDRETINSNNTEPKDEVASSVTSDDVAREDDLDSEEDVDDTSDVKSDDEGNARLSSPCEENSQVSEPKIKTENGEEINGEPQKGATVSESEQVSCGGVLQSERKDEEALPTGTLESKDAGMEGDRDGEHRTIATHDHGFYASVDKTKDTTLVKVPGANSPRHRSGLSSKVLTDSQRIIFREPFKHGWKRELVHRAVGGGIDVYYYIPKDLVAKQQSKKTKLRSLIEVESFLNKMNVENLTVKNFTWWKGKIGGVEDGLEFIRFAKQSNIPGCVESDSSKFVKHVKVLKSSKFVKHNKVQKPHIRKVANPKTTFLYRKRILENGFMGSLAKKRKVESQVISDSPKKFRSCSLECPGLEDQMPTLSCNLCLMLYHPACAGIDYAKGMDQPPFVCKVCKSEMLRDEDGAEKDVPLSNGREMKKQPLEAHKYMSPPKPAPRPLPGTTRFRVVTAAVKTPWNPPAGSTGPLRHQILLPKGCHVVKNGTQLFIQMPNGKLAPLQLNPQVPSRVPLQQNSINKNQLPQASMHEPLKQNSVDENQLPDDLPTPNNNIDDPLEKSRKESDVKDESEVSREKEDELEDVESAMSSICNSSSSDPMEEMLDVEREVLQEPVRKLSKEERRDAMWCTQRIKQAFDSHNVMENFCRQFAFRDLNKMRLVCKAWDAFIVKNFLSIELSPEHVILRDDCRSFLRSLYTWHVAKLDLTAAIVSESAWSYLSRKTRDLKSVRELSIDKAPRDFVVAVFEEMQQLASFTANAITVHHSHAKDFLCTALPQPKDNKTRRQNLHVGTITEKHRHLSKLTLNCEEEYNRIKIPSVTLFYPYTNISHLSLLSLPMLKDGASDFLWFLKHGAKRLTALELGPLEFFSEDSLKLLTTMTCLRELSLHKRTLPIENMASSGCTISWFDDLKNLTNLETLRMVEFDLKREFYTCPREMPRLKTLKVTIKHKEKAWVTHAVHGIADLGAKEHPLQKLVLTLKFEDAAEDQVSFHKQFGKEGMCLPITTDFPVFQRTLRRLLPLPTKCIVLKEC